MGAFLTGENDMEIKEVIKLKEYSELEIARILCIFYEKTGLIAGTIYNDTKKLYNVEGEHPTYDFKVKIMVSL